MDKHPNKWRRAREEAGFTREKAAEILKVSDTTLKEIEKDPNESPREPKRELQGAMAFAYNASWLLDSDLDDDYLPCEITQAFMQFDCDFDDVEKLISTAKRIIADGKIAPDERDEVMGFIKELKEASVRSKELMYSLSKALGETK
jgi:DNA-binding XRE family transcriptional regulator